jgi:hypothetical protein
MAARPKKQNFVLKLESDFRLSLSRLVLTFRGAMVHATTYRQIAKARCQACLLLESGKRCI